MMRCMPRSVIQRSELQKQMAKRLVIPQEVIENSHKTLGTGLRAKPTVQPAKYERVNTRVDYQPDLCKDFYETGYCGYGDNCKFIHDRSETKSSLVLEREWEQSRRREAERSAAEERKAQDEAEAAEQARAEAERRATYCPVCSEAYGTARKAMETKCGHWVCSRCAIGLKQCPVCAKPTSGVFKAVRRK